MNILTFDIEEWFHILDNESTTNVHQWDNYEVRIHENTDRILYFLEKNNLNATFFIVGWIAEKYPEIIKKIDSFQHEIGSHTYYHQLMYNQNSIEVNNEIKMSIEILQNITGKKVRSFRAPGFSITNKNEWVFESLINNGITHDCSVFPSNRAHGGLPNFPKSTPCLINFKGSYIKEFPINTCEIFGKKFIFSGGGYFRLIPYWMIKRFSLKSKYVMTYFHPRDFDPDQPIISDLNFFRRFKSYVGLKGSLSKLELWTNDFKFVDLRTADKKIDWKNIKTVEFL